MSETKEVSDDLKTDPRWKLIERILATVPFQKSARLRHLLSFMAERSLHNQTQDLVEHRIGHVVFGKPLDYSVVEDSSVRVHVRQLRLKLHEYYDGEGRGEPIIVEIPKGAYITVFRTVEQPAPEAPPPRKAPRLKPTAVIPWIVAALSILCAIVFYFRPPRSPQPAAPPWPLSTLFMGSGEVRVVSADVNYGMLRILSEKPGSLEQYLSPDYQHAFTPPNPSDRELRLAKYLTGSQLTSYADLVVYDTLSRLCGADRDRLSVRSARELQPRDLEQGNYIFIGSPGSNPWVSFFQNRLTFRETEGVVGQSIKAFENLHPRPGEQASYQGLEFTGTAGEDYATISLLPLPTGRGNVLLLQGLQQEGTEAASLFLSEEANRQRLRSALGISGKIAHPVYFEALIRTRAMGGAPNSTSLVAARLIQP